MWNILSKITKNLVFAIPSMMVLGFVFGIYSETGFLKNLIVPFTFLMVYPMMVTLKIKKVFEGGDTKAQLLTQFINFAVIPFVAFGIGKVFFPDKPYMALGLLLVALLPTSGMTISWTGFAKGNIEAAVKMAVIGLTLGSLAAPFYVQFLMGAYVEVNIANVMKQIAFIVFLPMAECYETDSLYRIPSNGSRLHNTAVAYQKIWTKKISGKVGSEVSISFNTRCIGNSIHSNSTEG
jgi:ACR3 family arsenite efflux pump ArsB